MPGVGSPIRFILRRFTEDIMKIGPRNAAQGLLGGCVSWVAIGVWGEIAFKTGLKRPEMKFDRTLIRRNDPDCCHY
jgi:hypothetical protein